MLVARWKLLLIVNPGFQLFDLTQKIINALTPVVFLLGHGALQVGQLVLQVTDGGLIFVRSFAQNLVLAFAELWGILNSAMNRRVEKKLDFSW